MSRFAVLALTLTAAIILIGIGFRWYLYAVLFSAPTKVMPAKEEPQKASIENVVKIEKETETKKDPNVQNAFEELPQPLEN